MATLLTGKLIRLSAVDPEEFGNALAHWSLDSEYDRLLSSKPARPCSAKAVKDWAKKELDDESSTRFPFVIRTLVDGRLIGDIDLEIVAWPQREAFVGLGIGERDLWDHGYGTDAMNVILRFAFMELNLRRVALDVFEYNTRAIHSYEKTGFRHEGRQRDFLVRAGRRWDMLYMGILRKDWMDRNGYTDKNQ